MTYSGSEYLLPSDLLSVLLTNPDTEVLVIVGLREVGDVLNLGKAGWLLLTVHNTTGHRHLQAHPREVHYRLLVLTGPLDQLVALVLPENPVLHYSAGTRLTPVEQLTPGCMLTRHGRHAGLPRSP